MKNPKRPTDPLLSEEFQELLNASAEFQRYAEVTSFTTSHPVIDERDAFHSGYKSPVGLVVYQGR